MKYLRILLPVLILAGSCQFRKGSGVIITEKRITGDFTGINAGGAFEVELKHGAATEVVAEADDNFMPYVQTMVSDGILKIGLKNLYNYRNAHLKIYITAPEIRDIMVSALAEVTVVDQLKNEGMLKFTSSSSGSIKAEVDAPGIESIASSGSGIRLSGKTRTYRANVSSGAEIKAAGLLSENAEVSASSGGSALVHASISLSANASSGGSIRYHGGARVDKNISSGGRVEPGE